MRLVVRLAHENGRGKDGERFDAGEHERGQDARGRERQDDPPEAGRPPCAEGGRGVFQGSVDASEEAHHHEERERQRGEHRGDERAPVVVEQVHLRQADVLEQEVGPSERREDARHALGDQDAAEGDRQHHHESDQLASAEVAPALVGQRRREPDAGECDRQRQSQGLEDRLDLVGVGEEVLVVGEHPSAGLRLERDGDAVDEGVEEQSGDHDDCGKEQQQRVVDAVLGQPVAQRLPQRGRGGGGYVGHWALTSTSSSLRSRPPS